MESSTEHQYEMLCRSEYQSIVRAAYLITLDREAARDVAQETFLQLYLHWHKVQGLDRPGAWLRRVAIRRAVKERQRSHPAMVEPSLEAAEPGESLASFVDSLSLLTPMQRAAIVLRYYMDLPVSEISECLKVRPSTVSVHLHRARERLANDLVEGVPNGLA
jgi:RNA polymerase sigma factor (sigma-70 family)